MKRVFGLSVAALALLVCLCGCGQRRSVDPITDGFTAGATIRYKDMDVQGQLSCSTDGRVTMDFSLPKSLEGVTLSWDGTAMQMRLGQMTLSVPEDRVPDGGLIRRLTQVLSSAAPRDGAWEGEDYVITGEAEGVAYTLVCDAATGLPKSLSVPSESLTATFSEVTIL